MANSSSIDKRRRRLAIMGGFVGQAPHLPHGLGNSEFALTQAIARAAGCPKLDVFYDNIVDNVARVHSTGPDARFARLDARGLSFGLRESATLPTLAGVYEAVYVPEGQPPMSVVMRPLDDWTPFIVELGVSHSPRQWTQLFLAAFSGGFRDTDAFIVKYARHADLLAAVWSDWTARVGALPKPRVAVLPNAVDCTQNRRDDALRASTRARLGLTPKDVVFLAFSRLSPHTKGDQRALVVLWREVLSRCPEAVLVLAGAITDPLFKEELLTTARGLGVSNRVIVLGDPYDAWLQARTALMSASDVFVHLTTGVEEAMSLVVLEAMAHELPVITTRWAGLRDVISHGKEGWLVDTAFGAISGTTKRTVGAYDPALHNGDMSRYVACDPRQLLESVAAAAGDRDRTIAMGRAARARVEAQHSMGVAGDARVAFFREAAGAAERAWRGTTSSITPLVNVDHVLESLAERKLADDDVVEIASRDALPWLPEHGIAREVLDAIVATLDDESGPMTVRTLRESIMGEALDSGSTGTEDEGRRLFDRLVLRLLNYHVVTLRSGVVPAVSASEERSPDARRTSATTSPS